MTVDSHASPFACAQGELFALGYHPIPVMPLEKAPGEYDCGRWRRMARWQDFRGRAADAAARTVWARAPGGNIGLVLGSPAGDGLFVIAVDIDAEDPDALADIAAALPPSPMVKRGAKGETRFYRATEAIRSAAYDDTRAGGRRRLMDLLTGCDARQTVVPPSVHVDRAGRPSGKVYQWLAGPVAADALPLFDIDDLTALEETLEQHGWTPKAATRRENAAHKNGGVFADVKAAAMADLAAWVPDLGLYRCRPARGGYAAVAGWRPSSAGRPLAQRSRNLSIQPSGIKDFGTGETYTPIDLVMAARGETAGWAADWLRRRVGLDAASSKEAVTADAHSRPRGPSPDPKGDGAEAGELPAALTRVPGLVGEIVEWICATARRPQRGLALGAALTLVGTAAGRKYAGPTRTGTQLYVLALARTAAGKDHAYQAIPQILTAAGLARHIGPSSFMSVSAVVGRMTREPLTLCAMDEFGSFMARMKNRRGSTHEQAIPGYLRTLWSSSFRTVPSPEWATRTAEPVHAPSLSIYGVSTLEEFYAALSGGDLSNGFLNRFLLISTRTRPAERDARADPHDIPRSIIQTLRRIAAAGSPFAHHGQADPPAIVAPFADEAARQVYADFSQGLEVDDAGAAFFARTAEMAQRLALIRAIGQNPETPRLSTADMRWGCEIALWSAARMRLETGDYMAETEHQATAQKILRILKSRGETKHGDLVRAMQHQIRARDLKDLVSGLIEAGQVSVRDIQGESGPPARHYRLAPTPLG